MGNKSSDANKVYIVYKTTNLINNKIYIGKSTKSRKSYLGSGVAIKAAIRKYGREHFKRDILFVFENEEEAYLKEAELVTTEFINRKDTYNIGVGGYGFTSGESHPLYGKSPSEVTRQKMSIAQSGKVTSDDTKLKLSTANKGKHHSDETKKKMSIAQSGKVTSDEAKLKMSISKRGENNPMFGKVTSDETKLKISIANKGRVTSDETKLKISIANKGKNNAMYGKTGIDNPNYGKRRTDEAKLKMSIIQLGEEVYYQRLKDVKEIEKVRGWKSKLARKWSIIPASVTGFLKNWFPEYVCHTIKDKS